MSKISVNYIYNLSYQVLAVIIPIITIPYVSRVLGPKVIGSYDYSAGIASYFAILALSGTQHYGQREIAITQDNTKNKSVVFLEVVLFRLLSTVIVTILYVLMITLTLKEYRLLLQIQIIMLISLPIDISWFYQGTEEFGRVIMRNTIIKIASMILVFLTIKKTDDCIIYAIIITGSNLIANTTLWIHIRRKIVRVSLRELNIFRHTKGILALFVPVVAIQVYSVLDKTMLGALVNTTEVGYYSQGEKIVRLSLSCFTALVAVIIPRIAFLYSKGKKSLVSYYFEKAVSFLAFISMPLMIGFIVTSDVFVSVFLGSEFLPVVPVLQILSLLFPILGMGHLIGGIMISINKTRVYNISVISAACVNVLLNYLLISAYSMGAIGVSIATVFAELTCTSIQLYNYRKEFHMALLLEKTIKYLIPSTIMGLSIFILKNQFHSQLFALIASMLIGCVIYFGILGALRDEILYEIIKKRRCMFSR